MYYIGTLPTEMLPINSSGLIDGTPTTAGTFTFTVTATDANDCTGLREYTLVINAAPAIVSATNPILSEWGMIILTVLIGLMSIYGSSGLSVLPRKEKEYLTPGLRRPRDAEQGRRKRRQE